MKMSLYYILCLPVKLPDDISIESLEHYAKFIFLTLIQNWRIAEPELSVLEEITRIAVFKRKKIPISASNCYQKIINFISINIKIFNVLYPHSVLKTLNAKKPTSCIRIKDIKLLKIIINVLVYLHNYFLLYIRNYFTKKRNALQRKIHNEKFHS